MSGRVEILEHESDVLKNNPLGDPYARNLCVYLPPGYDQYSEKKYPVIFGLAGFTSSGVNHFQKKFLSQSMDEILDELIIERGMPDVIYVMPDCMTKYGGSQYVNSSAVGNYEDYLVQELVPFVDKRFRTNQKRGCVGGSSGGVGAFSLAAKYPNIFSAFASHSGDSGFEYCFLTEVPTFVQAMAKYDYKLENFVNNFSHLQPQDGHFRCLLNLIAMAACYSPNEKSPLGFDLPFDPYSGKIKREIWKQWLSHDPVHMVEKYKTNLKKLNFAFVDCGTKDQFNLFLGSRQLHCKLREIGMNHVYEEHSSDHSLLRKQQMKKSIPQMVETFYR